MASVFKKSDCQYWVACFRDRRRKQCRRSTHETDRKKALKIAQDWERIAQGKVDGHGIGELYRNIMQEASGVTIPHASAEEFIARWLKAKELEISPKSLVNYKIAMKRLLDCLGDYAALDIVVINREHLLNFRKSLTAVLAPKTTNTYLHRVKEMFRAAERDGYISKDPSKFVELVRDDGEEVRRPFTIPEIRRLLENAEGEWKTLILLGACTGQRLGDLCQLTWDNVDLGRKEIRLVSHKTKKRTTIPIVSQLYDHLMELSSSDTPGPISPRAYRAYRRYGSTWAGKRFANLLLKSGLREAVSKSSEGKHSPVRYPLSFHCFRHTANTLLKEAGVPDAVIMAIIGHKSVVMSEHYTHVGNSALHEAARRFPSL